MISGLYAASTSLDAIIHQQDAIAANLANVGVSGHKGESVVFRSFPEMKFTTQSPFVPPETRANQTTGRIGTGVGVDWAYYNFEAGPVSHTGVPTDLALDGDGFFMVETPRGNRLTRNSEFKIKFDGQTQKGSLTTTEGYPLLGRTGPIEVPADEKFEVDRVGNVVVDGRAIDKIRVVTVPDKNVLKPESGALFMLEEKFEDQLTEVPDAVVQQGYHEKSNVNMVVEMARMIESFRNYESSARVLTTLDRSLDQVVNTLGRV